MHLFLIFVSSSPWILIDLPLYVTSLLIPVQAGTSMGWHPDTQSLQKAPEGEVVVNGTHSMNGLKTLPGDSD